MNSTTGITHASGTSFSSPITAGMIACLWQVFPDKNNMEIMQAVMESGSSAENPNNQTGWGIPDYEEALFDLGTTEENIWIGKTTQWNIDSNWSKGVVPKAFQKVKIPSSPAGGNFPVIPVGFTAKCQELIIDDSSSITINDSLLINQ